MTSFDFTSTMLDEGTMFAFDSWICVANDSSGFNSHLADSSKPEASAANQCSYLDKFIDNLDELLLPDLTRETEKMSVFDATSTRVALDFSDRTQTDLRRGVLDSCSGYTMPPRSTRRLRGLSPSPTWRT
jgi:hypothetical protein